MMALMAQQHKEMMRLEREKPKSLSVSVSLHKDAPAVNKSTPEERDATNRNHEARIERDRRAREYALALFGNGRVN